MGDAIEEANLGPDDELDYKPPARWPWAVALVLLLGAGGYFGWQALNKPDPSRVLLAFNVDGYWWEGSEEAATLTDRFADDLAALGFEPVRAGDPESTAILESTEDPLAAARKLGAAFVIGGDFTLKVNTLPTKQGFFEIQATGAVTLQHVDDAEPISEPLSTWSGATREKRARTLAMTNLGKRGPPRATVMLLGHEVLAPVIRSDSAADPRLAGKLNKARTLMQLRTQQLGNGEKAYKALEKRRAAAEKGPAPVTRHAATATYEGLCGTSAKGFCFKAEPFELEISSRRSALYRRDNLEVLGIGQHDGSRQTLWSGYNIYSYPRINAAGDTVGLCEDLFGWAKTVTIVKGETSRRIRIDPEARFSMITPSPRGGRVAFYERACRRGCPTHLMVHDLDEEATRRIDLPPGQEGFFNGIAWLDEDTLAFSHRSSLAIDVNKGLLDKETADARLAGGAGAPEGADEEAGDEAVEAHLTETLARSTDTLWMVRLNEAEAKPEVLWAPETSMSLDWLSASADGQKVAIANNLRGIVVFDRKAGASKEYRPESARRPESTGFSPDGSQVVTTYRYDGSRDEEVTVLDLASGQFTRLTNNPYRDRYPKFSADGAHIYFESMVNDPNLPDERLNVISSVPAKAGG